MTKEKLADYYRKTVDINLKDDGGWAGCYYGVFTKVINENNYKNVAEVGIGYGAHAKYVLTTTNIDRLTLIDPMKFYDKDGFADDIMKCEAEVEGNNFNELYNLINKELEPWKDKYTWHRTESLNVTNEQVADGSLDCVFVDGDHRYSAVIADLNFWWKKVRSGGQMLGDDFWMVDVSRAVNEFAQKNKLTIDFLTRPDKTYKIYRFHKP
jgi:hypothetical protein